MSQEISKRSRLICEMMGEIKPDEAKPKKNQAPEISSDYTHPDGKQETITLDIESKLQDYLFLPKKQDRPAS